MGTPECFQGNINPGLAPPAPENVTSFKKMGRLPARSKIAGKAIFLWNVTGEGGVWRGDFKEWDLETRLGKYYDLPYSWKHSDLVKVSRR